MKKILRFLAITAALLGAASSFGATVAPINVQKAGDGTNGMTANLDVPASTTLTIDAFGILTIQPNAVVNFPAGFIPWASINKSGSSLADLTTRSATDLSSGTVATARLYTTAVGYNITGGAKLDQIAGLAPTANQFLQYNAGGTAYQASTISPAITLGSDLTGSVTLTNLTSGTLNGTVVKVNGVSYGAAPATNTMAIVTGANTTTYELVPNASLANSSITIGGALTALGGTVTASTIEDSISSTRGSINERGAAGWVGITPGTATYVMTSNGAGADPSYQQVSLTAASITGVLAGVNGGTGVNNTGKTITLGGNLTTSGAFATTLTVGATTTVTLPATGTLVGSADTGTVTNTMLAGSIANAKLTNSSVTIGSTAVSLGGTATTIAGLTLTTPVISTGLTASGAAANDFSASTGTFLTSSGANTLNGATTINAAVTPSLTTAAGKTNTGLLQVNGKTSGAIILTTADATAQSVTVTTAAQTIGATTLTIPNMAGVSDTFDMIGLAQTLANKTLTNPVINGATSSGSTAINFGGNTGAFTTSTGANTLSGATTINDATTPSLTTAAGKTNTGFVLINGKTSGGLKLLPADASAQTVTLALAAQTVGAATLTIPDQAGTARNLVTDTSTQTLTNKTLSTSTSVSAALTFTAGVRQTFAPNATTPGFNPGSNAGDPSTPSNGDIWYDSTGNLLRARVNGATLTVGAAGGTVTHTVGALTANQIVLGNGAADTVVLGSLGTTTTVLHGNAGGAPSFGAVVLTTDVSGILPVLNGGTGITSLGAGIATWLGTPSSANLLAAVTGATGTGGLVFGTSPTIASPQISGTMGIGTAASGAFGLWLNATINAGTMTAGLDNSSTLTANAINQTFYGTYLFPTFATVTFTGQTGINLNLVQPAITGTGNLATSYQIYMAAAGVATTRWGLYQAGPDNNFLTGQLALGATAADASSRLWLGGSTTTVSGFAQGERITTTQTAAVNADVLSGLVTVPTYATGTFTGLVASGVWARTPSNTGTGTIALNYGVRADAVSVSTYAVGLATSSQTAGTSGNTDLLLGTQTPVTGNYGIYQGDTYANTLGGITTVDLNVAGGALPAPISLGTVMNLGNVDTKTAGIQGNGFGTSAMFLSGRAAGGTRASPSATPNNYQLVSFFGYGYDTALTTTPSITLALQTNSLWSVSNRETAFVFSGTPSGSTTQAQWMKLAGTGLQLDLGSAAGALPADIVSGSTLIHLGNADGVLSLIQADAYGNAGAALGLLGRSVGGTRASPSATPSGYQMVRMNAYGYDTAFTTTTSGSYFIQAGSLWSVSNRETKHVWQGTQSGSTTNGNWMTLDGTGLTLTNKVVSYNGAATAGVGVTPVVAHGRSTAQTAAVASVATYTVGAADASYEVSANVLVTTATTHAFTVTCAYTDEGNTARTVTLTFGLVAGGVTTTSIANANGTVPYMGAPIHIRAKAGTTITIATTGTFTTVTYNVEGTIIQLG